MRISSKNHPDDPAAHLPKHKQTIERAPNQDLIGQGSKDFPNGVDSFRTGNITIKPIR